MLVPCNFVCVRQNSTACSNSEKKRGLKNTSKTKASIDLSDGFFCVCGVNIDITLMKQTSRTYKECSRRKGANSPFEKQLL